MEIAKSSARHLEVYLPQRCVHENFQGPEASVEFARSFARGVHNFWDRRELRLEVYLPQRRVRDNFQGPGASAEFARSSPGSA